MASIAAASLGPCVRARFPEGWHRAQMQQHCESSAVSLARHGLACAPHWTSPACARRMPRPNPLLTLLTGLRAAAGEEGRRRCGGRHGLLRLSCGRMLVL
ncbi:hypothetical protein FA09DRAFT_19707 [Tilletiopsis washingtonensis]|jgi:hypothetical protein|uniref:Uncharacterized protein n=1 Tax=Tilletiopsis washingtonensis TaxID=58919 RepID=A0A316ZAW9_9BASI|nr:hypothetical protein FA09DRAFT_19707 [Tilletiopsis washingtonensis]PWN98168.1 hypothetical protein FA09DRAFT_19707 [Tilletiopsis washingtonensis]